MNIEEAADKYEKEHTGIYPEVGQTSIRDAFIDGAEWQKEQMMKRMIEGKIIYLLNGDAAINIGDTEEYNLGDKVKLIIIKED